MSIKNILLTILLITLLTTLMAVLVTIVAMTANDSLDIPLDNSSNDLDDQTLILEMLLVIFLTETLEVGLVITMAIFLVTHLPF